MRADVGATKIVPWTTYTLRNAAESRVVRFHAVIGAETVRITKWWGIIPDGKPEDISLEAAREYCQSLRDDGYELIKRAS